MSDSHLEWKLKILLQNEGIEFEREKWFHDLGILGGRNFRFDFVRRKEKIAIECQGGQKGKIVRVKGVPYQSISGHRSSKGLQDQCEKNNRAVLHGWKILYFTTDDFKKPDEILRQIKELIG